MTREMAEEEFARFLEMMDLTSKLEEKLDAEDSKNLQDCRSSIVRAIEDGSLVITGEDGGLALFTPKRGTDRKPFRFPEPSAGVLLAADKRRDGHNTAKTLAMLAEWSGENAQRFTNLKPVDFRVCTSLMALFFG